jgi:membrane fusion protein, copper/silver efflux system
MNRMTHLFLVPIAIASFLFFDGSPQSPSRVIAAAPSAYAQGHAGHGTQSKSEATEQKAAVSVETKEEAPSVEIPLDRQQFIGVKLAEARVQPFHQVIRTVGRIEYDERGLATVNTKFEGWIEKLYVDYTGMYVKRGDVLAEIYSPELFATQQEYVNLLRWVRSRKEDTSWGKNVFKDTEAILEAVKSRLRLWDITDDQIKEIEATGKPLRTLKIYSPVSGYVVQKMAILGMRVMPGEKLFDLADLSNVWVIADIYEYELPFIKLGMKAEMALSYLPGKSFNARVEYIYPYLSNETRTAKVRFTVLNQTGELKPQMFSNVEININLGDKLAIPDSAVLETGTRQIVYVEKGEGYFEPREILVGVRGEGLVEVSRGLRAGEKVASAANFLIDAEAQLKGITPLHKP